MSPPSRTIALVTGSNRGIGRATALALARDHNYTVILACRDYEAAKSTAEDLTSQLAASSSRQSAQTSDSATPKGSFIPIHLDYSSDESISALKNFITTTLDGQLNVLVNNAGILIDNFYHRPGYNLSPRELYTRTYESNTIGPAILTEELLPFLMASSKPEEPEGQPARIVFVSSTMGSITRALDDTTAWYNHEATAYDSSKAAVNMLGVQFSRRLRGVGGLVNVVCPGLVATRLTGGYGASEEVGASIVVRMATLGGKDGDEQGERVTGKFVSAEGEVPW